MLALIQRVTRAQVSVDGQTVGAIDAGILALVAVEPGDGEAQVQRTCDRLLGYRIFDDGQGRMNRCLAETGGGLLLVSQFTLAADTRKGMRPGFSTAAAPADGLRWYDRLVEIARGRHPEVATGRYGAHMLVESINDGPVTFILTARAPVPIASISMQSGSS